jgi:hypothetical protein
MRLLVLLAVSLWCLLAPPARADSLEAAALAPAEQLQGLVAEDREFLNSATYLQFLMAKFLQLEPVARKGSCADLQPMRRDLIVLVDHLLVNRRPDGKTRLERTEEFASSTYSNKYVGAWGETWRFSACGQTVRRGVVVLKTVGGDLEAIPLVPGTTLTDLRLQIDTLKIALPAFTVAGCQERNFTIMDVQVLDAAKIAEHQWSERWTLQRCGQQVSRQIDFAPGAPGTNAGGTTIIVKGAPPQ